MFLTNLFSRKKEHKGLTIAEILAATQAGRVQTVGLMQVIPLISEEADDRFALPSKAEVSTSGYGSMVFSNPEDKVLIVPAQIGYVVKQAAQDHAMASAGLVRKQGKKTYKNAMCIQQSQGGFISAGQHQMLILPFSLREAAISKRKEHSYNKLWEVISTFNSNLGLKKHGHIEYFLKHFKKELDQFVAEFECVPNQVGAIVLIDGKVVGIERTPSPAFWKAVWPALIRECYGSLAIECAKRLGEGVAAFDYRQPLRKKVRSLAELKRALEQANTDESEMVKTKVRELLGAKFKLDKEDQAGNFIQETASHAQFIGQIVREGEVVKYASLVTRKSWADKLKWFEVPTKPVTKPLPFTI